VIVCGASSQVGRFLLPRLSQAGWPVIALSRQGVPAWAHEGASGGPGAVKVAWQRADVANAASLAALPRAATLIHLAPLACLPASLPAFAALGVRRVIAFSSSSKFSKAQSPVASERAFAARLQAAEDALAEQCVQLGMRWTVFRPTLIYGCGMDRNVALIIRVIERLGFFPLLGEARGLRQPVHADDLAAACVAALAQPASFDKAYELSGGETLSYKAMVERIYARLGRRPRFLPVPIALFALALRLLACVPRYRDFNAAMAQRMNEDLVYPHTEAQRDLGYRPRSFQP
ncbi:MAG: NAD-dependent epimerase/dehydratase family protein, partial [Sterolibacterium sp.]|nr:NAD-dependent epimerase/dehydratase family protein [Sterolibacterium sp.]